MNETLQSPRSQMEIALSKTSNVSQFLHLATGYVEAFNTLQNKDFVESEFEMQKQVLLEKNFSNDTIESFERLYRDDVNTFHDERLTLRFDEFGKLDFYEPLAGGKNASLAEMYKNLSTKGVNIPDGVAITRYFYDEFIRSANLSAYISDKLNTLVFDTDEEGKPSLSEHDVIEVAEDIRSKILETEFSSVLKIRIQDEYRIFCAKYNNGKDTHVALGLLQ